MSWNEENVAQLRELWDQGLPTSQIGKILNFTKNAVVGKAHRIGLERRPSPIKRRIMKPDRKKARAPLMPSLSFDSKSENGEILNKDENLKYSTRDKFLAKKLLNNNKNNGCEWPFGHPNETDFNYCGLEKEEGKPYCSKHCDKAYIAPEKMKSNLAAKNLI